MNEDEQPEVGLLTRLRNDPNLVLVVIRYAVFISISIMLLATVALSVLAWQSSASLGDRLAELGAIFAGMTLLLTMFAALVAYTAFSVSFGFAVLKLEVRFGSPRPKGFEVAAERKNGRLEVTDPAQTKVSIYLRNEGRFPAKELAVIVQLDGMEFVPDMTALNAAGWAVNARSETGVVAVQWDGGADYPVLPGFVREITALNLSGLHTIPGGISWTWMKRYVPRRYYRRAIRSGKNSGPHDPQALIMVSIRDAASRQVSWRPVYFMVNEKSQPLAGEGNA
jgi:hypothetical protein